MSKVLVTGFDPFGGEVQNPSFEVLKLLPRHIGSAEIVPLEVPTVFYKAFEVLKDAINVHKPDLVICVGQAGGRAAITLEKVAINLNDARIPDNMGQALVDTAIVENGPTAYFTNLPIKAMMSNILASGIPAAISYSAGTFVCNHIFYLLMHLIVTEQPTIRGGFIHVPYSEQQAASKPKEPSMSLITICKALEIAIDTALKTDVDLIIGTGSDC